MKIYISKSYYIIIYVFVNLIFVGARPTLRVELVYCLLFVVIFNTQFIFIHHTSFSIMNT